MSLAVHPAVVIGGLSGISAALGLIASLARSVYKNAATAAVNAGRLENLFKDVEELKDAVAAQGTDVAVLKALADADNDQPGRKT
jgi:hypothetical protein